jgi:hypothetical protein
MRKTSFRVFGDLLSAAYLLGSLDFRAVLLGCHTLAPQGWAMFLVFPPRYAKGRILTVRLLS